MDSKEMKIVSIDDLSVGDQFYYSRTNDTKDVIVYRILGVQRLGVYSDFDSEYLVRYTSTDLCDACSPYYDELTMCLNVNHGSMVVGFRDGIQCMVDA